MIIVPLVSPRVNEILMRYCKFHTFVQYSIRKHFCAFFIPRKFLMKTSSELATLFFGCQKLLILFVVGFFISYSVKSVSVSQLPTVSQDNPRTSYSVGVCTQTWIPEETFHICNCKAPTHQLKLDD